MKLIRVLIILLILTASASVYAMGIYAPFFPSASPVRVETIEIKQEAPRVFIRKNSAVEKKISSLMEVRHYRRLLAASS